MDLQNLKNTQESYINQVTGWTNEFVNCLKKKTKQPDLECNKILNQDSVNYFLKYYKELFENKNYSSRN